MERKISRKVFHDSVIELPQQIGVTATGLNVSTVRPENMDEKMTLSFSLAIPQESTNHLEAKVASGQVLSVDDLNTKYAVSQTEVDPLLAWLKGAGFQILHVSNDRTSIVAQATAGQIEKALDVKFVRVTKDGITYTTAQNAPSMPSEFAQSVHAIGGLQPFRHAQAFSARFLPPQPRGHTKNSESASVPRSGDPQSLQRGWFAGNRQGANDCHSDRHLSSGFRSSVVLGKEPCACDAGADSENQRKRRHAAPRGRRRDTRRFLGQRNRAREPPCAFMPADRCNSPLLMWRSTVFSATFHRSPECTSSPLASDWVKPSWCPPRFELNTKSTFGWRRWESMCSSPAGMLGLTRRAGQGSGGPLQCEYSSSDTAVVGVGGTSLFLKPDGSVAEQTGWSGSGGGKSTFFSGRRGRGGRGCLPATSGWCPMSVSRPTQVKESSSFLNGVQIPLPIGGTSWSTPVWAGFCALINEARAIAGKPSLPFLNPLIYPLLGTSAFRDIVQGNNGVYDAGPGYDLVTGLGVPNVKQLIEALTL